MNDFPTKISNSEFFPNYGSYTMYIQIFKVCKFYGCLKFSILQLYFDKSQAFEISCISWVFLTTCVAKCHHHAFYTSMAMCLLWFDALKLPPDTIHYQNYTEWIEKYGDLPQWDGNSGDHFLSRLPQWLQLVKSKTCHHPLQLSNAGSCSHVRARGRSSKLVTPNLTLNTIQLKT